MSPWADRPHAAAVIMDYDGTLAAIVDDPAEARPVDGALDVLAALAKKLSVVAVVSGRPVQFLISQLGAVPGLLLSGIYGLEQQHGGRRAIRPGALDWAPAISEAADAAQREAPPGVRVERKGLSFVLHTRKHPGTWAWATDWATSRAAASGLRAQTGRMAIELLPPLEVDKGTVVGELASTVDAVCYVGDDIGDLPAFSALSRMREKGKRTLAVGVTSAEQPEALAEAVDVLVEGPLGALELLRRFL